MASVCKRTPKGTRNADKYLVAWYDYETERWRTKIGYTDRELSLRLGQRLEMESARRREGVSSIERDNSLKPVDEPLKEFIQHRRVRVSDEEYLKQLENRIRRLLKEANVTRLYDLDAPKIEAALQSMRTMRRFGGKSTPLAASSKNEYIVSIKGFTAWAAKNRRVERDPLEGLAKLDERKAEKVHPRRALSVEERERLLDAALRRPEIEVRMIRTGPRSGQQKAKVWDHVIARARRTGRERRCLYLVALWSGLRRAELTKLEWRDVQIDVDPPHLALRSSATKSKRDDAVPLHPQAVEALRKHKPRDAKPTDLVFPVMPTMKVFKADLAFAGIKYGNTEIGYADFHAQRTTLNTMLAAYKIDRRTRQAQLRHTDPRLTETTYFDRAEFLAPHARQIAQVPPIGGHVQKSPVIPALPAASSGAQIPRAAEPVAESIQNKADASLHPTPRQPVKHLAGSKPAAVQKLIISLGNVTKKNDPAPPGTGSF